MPKYEYSSNVSMLDEDKLQRTFDSGSRPDVGRVAYSPRENFWEILGDHEFEAVENREGMRQFDGSIV